MRDSLNIILMKRVVKKSPEKAKSTYVKPKVVAVTEKTSMSGAGCPTHTVQWQQVSCKC